MNKLTNFLKKYNSRPVINQAIQAGMLMGVGDAIAQLYVEKKPLKEFNYNRTRNYAMLGFLYVGPALRLWYGKLDKLFPSKSPNFPVKKVIVDQLFFAPAFMATVLTFTMKMNGATDSEVAEKMKKEYKNILLTNYKIWPAVMFVNFTFVPLHYQPLVTQTVAVFWNVYFAWKAHQPVVESKIDV